MRTCGLARAWALEGRWGGRVRMRVVSHHAHTPCTNVRSNINTHRCALTTAGDAFARGYCPGNMLQIYERCLEATSPEKHRPCPSCHSLIGKPACAPPQRAPAFDCCAWRMLGQDPCRCALQCQPCYARSGAQTWAVQVGDLCMQSHPRAPSVGFLFGGRGRAWLCRRPHAS